VLFERIKELGCIHGIGFIGVAGLGEVKNEIKDISGSVYIEYPKAISIGIILQNSIVDLLYDRDEYENVLLYKTHAYNVINSRLDHFSSVVGSVIQQNGFDAMPLPASERLDSDRVCASLSHKAIARLAGFGWIGKNCLLINPDYGPRIRWTSVLTNAPIQENKEIIGDNCGECKKCVNACPASAILGRNFSELEPRESRVDVRKCEAYYETLKDQNKLQVCGMCLYVCPFGRKQ